MNSLNPPNKAVRLAFGLFLVLKVKKPRPGEFKVSELHQGLNPCVLKILLSSTSHAARLAPPHPTPHCPWALFPVGPDDSPSCLADIVVFDNSVNE